MTLIIEPIHIWWLVCVALAFLGAAAKLGGWLVKRVTESIDKRFATLANSLERDAAAWRTVERDLMNLRAELPERYVRREDYIRGQTVVESKLDALAARLELIQLKGVRHD